MLAQARVTVGAEVLLEQRLDLLRGKRIGLITNHTGRLPSGEFLIDALRSRGMTIVALFGPEHGVRGSADAGETIRDTTDPATGVPVYSLYGTARKPTPQMLTGVDVLVYDIQDVGTRFYTYISTMALSMEAAAEKGIPFVLLDRPNPLGGLTVDGPILEDTLRSFVGMFPIPVVYGLTCGELAEMINAEGWLAHGAKVDLTVVRMAGWTRRMLWHDTGLPWIPPSPNIPTPETALMYPATCMFEGTNVSEGRGTRRPFETIGAPFVDKNALAAAVGALGLPGVQVEPTSFTPSSSKFEGQVCSGVVITVRDAKIFKPTLTGLYLVQQFQRLSSSHFTSNPRTFARLLGTARGWTDLLGGVSPKSMEAAWEKDIQAYRTRSLRFYLYPGH